MRMKTYSTKPGSERVRWIGCNLCGSRDQRPYWDGKDFIFVRCSNCGLVFQNPQPVFDDLRFRYDELYYDYELTNEENFFNLMKLGLKDIHFRELSATLPEPRRFLDIGCATGMLLSYIREWGWEVRGVELCRQSAEDGILRKKLDIHIGTVEQAEFPDAYFSVIHFSHLIEHVPDPLRLLSEVHRILLDDGYAIVVTPNIAGFQARLFKTKWRSAIVDHLTLFSKRTLCLALQAAGFDVLKTVTWGGLAVGAVPGFVKRPVDYLAKKFGFGDVVLMLVRKSVSDGTDRSRLEGG